MYASRIKVGTIIKMKIGIYDPYLDDIGGGEKYMLTVAACLSQQHDVTIFWNIPEDVAAVAKRFSIQLDTCKIASNIFSKNFSTWQRLQATHAYDALIVLSDGSVPLSLSKYLFLHIQQPLSIALHESILENFKRSRVTKIFYNSPFTSEKNSELFKGIPSTIIYPPVKHIHVKEPKENIILHVGRFRPMNDGADDFKKQTVMINTFKDMVDKGLKGWKFLLAAGVLEKDQKAFEVLKKDIIRYPIEFVENASSNELAHLYARAKIYWHASGYGEDLEKNPELAEHFGISTVEAMSAGAVPVVINAGGQPEIVSNGENGLVWNTLEEFKSLTLKIIKDRDLWKELSEKAIKRSKDFDTEKFCKDINALLA